MDSKHNAEEAASASLKYQTWFLKVAIHCEGCRRKVKKVLQSIDGVFTTTVDQQQQKVTVTGTVAVETLLRKLLRAGKHAEIWPQNPDGDAKISGQPKKNTKDRTEKRTPKNYSSSEKKRSTESASTDTNKERKGSKAGENSPGKSPAGNPALPGQRDGGGGGNKKKTKNGLGSSGSGSSGAAAHSGLFQFQNEGQDVGRVMREVNLSPTRQQSYLYDVESGYPPMMYVAAAYNNRLLYPNIGGRMGGYPCYYVAPTLPSPFNVCAGIDQHRCQFQSRPFVSFEIFSDENANGCSIM